MPEERTATLGELIDVLVQVGAFNQSAFTAQSKVTGPALQGTVSCHYQLQAMRYHELADKWGDTARSIKGYNSLRGICEADGTRITADKLRQFRGQLYEARGIAIADSDAMNVEDFVNAVLQMRREDRQKSLASAKTKLPVAMDKPIFTVSNWTDLAIGVRADWTYWAFTPVPIFGDIFPMSQATQLKLAGDRWREILKALAETLDPMVIAKESLIRVLNPLPPPSRTKRDARARPGAQDSALREELPSTERPASRSFSNTLADLRRKLKGEVDCTDAKGSCLAIDGKIVRPGFVVRFLFDGPSGQKRFGRRPE